MRDIEDLKQRFLLIGIFLMSCIDAVFTLLWISLSVGEEINPVLEYCLQWGPLLFILAKTTLTFAGASILFLCRKRKLAKLAASFLFIFYFLLILYHCFGSVFILLSRNSF